MHEIILNSPLKRGERLGSGSGSKCYEDPRFYASVMGYEIVRAGGERDYKRVPCLSVTLMHPCVMYVTAFGDAAKKAINLRQRQDDFHERCNQSRPSPSYEERLEHPELKAIRKEFHQLCEQTLIRACAKPGVLNTLMKACEENGRKKGTEETQAAMRKALGINEVY